MDSYGSGQLQGKAIVVTGGAQGIGEATARICAARGASVTIADVSAENGERVAAAIQEAGGQAIFQYTDVRLDEQVRSLMAGVRERHGRLDVLINTAGIFSGGHLQPEEFSLEMYERIMEVNVKGVFLCVKHATPLLEASGRGVILIIASSAGVRGPSSSLAYGASKGGVNGLGMTLENHLKPRNIRVNVVCPGQIDTKLKVDAIALAAQRAGQSPDEAVSEARRTSLGTPDGVGRVLAFLASDDADYVRGTLFTH